jgi:hypothetical protein
MATLRIFLYLPPDETVVHVISAQNDFNIFIASIEKAINSINELENTTIYYDKENISSFFIECEKWNETVYLENARNQIRILGNKMLEIVDNCESLISANNIYLTWNQLNINNLNYAPRLISEAAERLFQYPDEPIRLLNFGNALASDRPKILVFKDELNLQNPTQSAPPLPHLFAHIPFFQDNEQLRSWLNSFRPRQLNIPPNQIQQLINRGETNIIFKRIDTPKVLGEQIHIHFNDKAESALNIDGTWKHGAFTIPEEAKQILEGWGFTLPA